MSTTRRALLKASEIDAMDVKPNTHSLNDNAIRLVKSLGDATGLTQLGFHLVTVMPGHDSTEYHRHLYEEECVYILSGVGEATLGDEVHAMGPGDFIGFPRAGFGHKLSNTGNTPLVFVAAGQRLEHDVCDYPHKGKRLYMAGSNKAWTELAPQDE